MVTAQEFVKTGMTGHTFREIREKFGQSFDRIPDDDKLMTNYALAFAWVRVREQLPIDAAYDKALNMTTAQIEALFEDSSDPLVKAQSDFVSQPPATTP